jgi:hypothetical protein
MLFIFSTPVLIRHLWQLKTVVFLHWCPICAALLPNSKISKHYFCGGISYLQIIFLQIFWPALPARGIPNKDYTVCLDGTRPANTCIPPSLPGNVQPQNVPLPTPKNMFAMKKELAIKITVQYIVIIYNLEITVFSDVDLPKCFTGGS